MFHWHTMYRIRHTVSCAEPVGSIKPSWHTMYRIRHTVSCAEPVGSIKPPEVFKLQKSPSVIGLRILLGVP